MLDCYGPLSFFHSSFFSSKHLNLSATPQPDPSRPFLRFWAIVLRGSVFCLQRISAEIIAGVLHAV